MYKSPIEVFRMQDYQIENEIMNVILKYDIAVDKDELIRALRYDRDQYDKGYADGKMDSLEVVRCKYCRHSEYDDYHGDYYCRKLRSWCNSEFYCAYGKEEEEDDD